VLYLGFILEVNSYKSIEHLEIELADLTILVGPPGAGKSNILDALALAGYFQRFNELTREYRGLASNLEPLTIISRFQDYYQLFRYYDLNRIIGIRLSGMLSLDVKIFFASGMLKVMINDIQIPWDLRTLRSDPMSEVQSATQKANISFESRLYGFDRYSLASNFCAQPYLCGFHIRLSNPQQAKDTPANVLSELGWNAPQLAKRYPQIFRSINNELLEYIGEKVELKVLRTGAIAIFDYDVELEFTTISETVFRTLYTLLALESSHQYVKTHGLEKKYAVILEEPEAHVFPFFLNLIVEHIKRVMENMYVVISTHNPLFISLLWDRIKNLETYYVYRDAGGSTHVSKLDIDKMAKNMVMPEELLLQSPTEVLRKYTIGADSLEEDQAKGTD
jgi:energy-coupling factor transporter ATP-binding protein EcfA2